MIFERFTPHNFQRNGSTSFPWRISNSRKLYSMSRLIEEEFATSKESMGKPSKNPERKRNEKIHTALITAPPKDIAMMLGELNAKLKRRPRKYLH